MEKYQKKTGPVKVAAPPPKAKPVQSGKSAVSPSKTVDFAFTKENYRLMLIGLALMALGFILMIGGGSKDPNDFSPDIFNFQRITLAPILILAGYVVEIFAIMKKSKD
jgi:Protein of unknown function (DUF3098)